MTQPDLARAAHLGLSTVVDFERTRREVSIEAIAALRRYSLVKRNSQEKTLSMHRLVQAVIIDTLSPELRTQWRERVVLALNAAFPEVEFKEWRKCERLVPHVQVCAMWTEHELTPTQEVSELFHKAGFYLHLQISQDSGAEALLMRVLPIYEQHLGAEHLRTARVMYDLAYYNLVQGKYEQAEAMYQQTLTIRENA